MNPVILPNFHIATLLYCFNRGGEVLLMKRALPPNAGLWSPCGGKLHTEIGESPYACACREAGEEIQVAIRPGDLHLTGIVSESGYQGQAHWLMFLFEVKPRLEAIPAPHREGTFAFHSRFMLEDLPLPRTDREMLWPLFWKHRGGFFAAHCLTGDRTPDTWTVEESILP